MVRSGNVAVFLQARIGSTRLPSKALFDLNGITAIGRAMIRLKRIKADNYVVLTDRDSYAILEKETQKYGFEIMEGPADDVLKRFALAIIKYSPVTFVRATGDNPLVFYRQAQFILSEHIEKNADHSWFTGMPLGAGVEIVKSEKLLEAEKNASDPYEREHVTPYLYRRPSLYNLNHPEADISSTYPEGRITMDTMNDYLYLKRIFEIDNIIGTDCLTESTERLIDWLKKNPHPDSNKKS
ncbi:MAG: acylneuraminate cytidylyltransferase [Spirochaetales bacterium]|nr:acylneuraminate cytidylyltransferase [Spirochaetales bacterium]